MAIKGKSKPKSKPKSVARAPRREPVAVKAPVFQRRWVQVTAAFIVGFFAMMLLVWVTNGLRQNRADDEAASAAATKRTAALAWQRQAESALGKAGTVTQGAQPVMFAPAKAALQTMQKGTPPANAAKTFRSASDDAQAAIDALTKFDLAGTIAGQGFNTSEALTFTDSKDRLINALVLYQKAAATAKLAAATGIQQKDLQGLANDLMTNADTEFGQAWLTFTSALEAGGIVTGIPGTASSLGG
jgi:hypothetical protein